MMDMPPCVHDMADRYGVPYALVLSVAKVESNGNHKAISKRNRNGTYDIGLMQINTVWLKELHKYGIGERELATDACVNAAVGSWILRKYFLKTGNWVDAISAYNAGPGNIKAGRRYALKVLRYWYQLDAGPGKRIAKR